MSAHLSDQALELLMAMSTGALARAGAKRYPALAQHFGIQPESPPAEQSMALVPVVPPTDEFPGVDDTAVAFGEPQIHRRVTADTLDASNRALMGRVPASVARAEFHKNKSRRGESRFLQQDIMNHMDASDTPDSLMNELTPAGGSPEKNQKAIMRMGAPAEDERVI